MTVSLRKPAKIERLTLAEAENLRGCWLDGGVRGWWSAADAVDLAAEYGFELNEEDRIILDAFRDGGRQVRIDGYDYDASGYVSDQGGLSDSAVTWLTENIAPEGWGFEWVDGDLVLWPYDDTEED